MRAFCLQLLEYCWIRENSRTVGIERIFFGGIGGGVPWSNLCPNCPKRFHVQRGSYLSLPVLVRRVRRRKTNVWKSSGWRKKASPTSQKTIDYAPWTVLRQRPRRLLRSLERRGRSSPPAPTGPDPDRCLTTGFSGPTGLGDFRGVRRWYGDEVAYHELIGVACLTPQNN